MIGISAFAFKNSYLDSSRADTILYCLSHNIFLPSFNLEIHAHLCYAHIKANHSGQIVPINKDEILTDYGCRHFFTFETVNR